VNSQEMYRIDPHARQNSPKLPKQIGDVNACGAVNKVERLRISRGFLRVVGRFHKPRVGGSIPPAAICKPLINQGLASLMAN
jgi:hypothetical protein